MMPVSRRRFVGNASAIAMLASLLSPDAAAELFSQAQQAPESAQENAPHDAYDYWSGFFDSVNPEVPASQKRDVGSQPMPDPERVTQYYNFSTENRALRYASAIKKEELLDHDGDVAATISLSQFRPGTDDQKVSTTQLRVDATQVHPLMNLFSPLAWTAIAAIKPTAGGKLPTLDQLGFKSEDVTNATSHILLTKGTGTMAVNISRAPNDSQFLKFLDGMLKVVKIAAPLVAIPAISVPALSTFSEAFGYWENRTRFLMNGQLTRTVATQQALDDKERPDVYFGLVSGDYVMVPSKHTDELEKEMHNLELDQGWLVPKGVNSDMRPDKRAEAVIPGVTYATMRISVTAIQPSIGTGAKPPADGSGGQTQPSKKPKSKSS